MRIAVDRRRPGRAVLRRAGQGARPEHRDHRLGAQRPRRHVRLRRGVLRRDPRRHRARRPGRSTPGWPSSSPAGTTSTCTTAGTVHTVGGHGFAAMSRKQLLQLLQARCAELGVEVRFRTEAPDVDTLARDYDLVVASDGANSAVRAKYADVFRPDAGARPQQVHVAGHRPGLRRLQVLRLRDAVRRDAGPRLPVRRHTAAPSSSRCTRTSGGAPASASRRRRVFPPGVSDEQSIARIRELFADVLEGHESWPTTPSG